MAKAGNAAEKDLVSKLGNDVKGVKNVENQMTIEEVTMKDKRKGYELDAQLEEWNAQIALLKAKADNGQGRGEDSTDTHRGVRLVYCRGVLIVLF